MHTHTHTQCTCWLDNDGENVCRADERQKFVSLSNLAGNKRSVVRGGYQRRRHLRQRGFIMKTIVCVWLC